MRASLASIQEWVWSGGPARRLLVGLLIATIFSAVLYPFEQDMARLMLSMGLSWNAGAYMMERTYLHRLSRK